MATSHPAAIALLEADQRKIEDLSGKIEATSQIDRKDTLARQIRMELIIHTMIEEDVFRPTHRCSADERLLPSTHFFAGKTVSHASAGQGDPNAYR